MVPDLSQLVLIMFLIPVQTAVVVRGFGLHRIIKSKLRNRLEIVTIDSFMCVLSFCAIILRDLMRMLQSKKVLSQAGCMVLNQLHTKVGQIEIGRLADGIDDSEPNFDFDFCSVDGSDDDGDAVGDDDALRLEDANGSDILEDESRFAPEQGSESVVVVEGEASILDNIYCVSSLVPHLNR